MFMDSNIVLDVRNVYKKYGKNNNATRILLKDELRFIFTKTKSKKLKKGEFFVLNNISFQLKQGETLGILGLNGSGKSTLLKMINGLLLPDFGEIYIDGEVGGFIELGAGFNSNLSGKQNIFIKGALLGKSKEEMQSLYNDIVEFAEIGDFINSPLKNYSSGMKARLGFAILVHIKPNILLMDEVLAVGDYKFRAKCMSKLNELREDISSILVSHSMQDIRQYCDRAIILEKGKMIFSGEVDKAIEYYIEKQNKQKQKEISTPKIKPFYGDLFYNKKKIKNINIYFANSNLEKITSVNSSEGVNIVIDFELTYKALDIEIGVPIYKIDGTYISGLNSMADNYKIYPVFDNNYKIILKIEKNSLQRGKYIAVVVIVDKGEALFRGLIDYELDVQKNKLFYGCVELVHKWKIGK
jgi:lipopolysaccharide transport system ATP-binding protein